MSLLRIPTATGAGISIALFIGQVGCSSTNLTRSIDVGKDAAQAGQGRAIASYSELKPDAFPGSKADMVMAGTRIPVNVSTKWVDSEFEILLKAHEETFETEVYRGGKDSFALVKAAGDQYTPDVQLVRFPMHIGDQWSWQGTVSSGGIRRKATALVRSSSMNLYENGVATEAVKAEVDLSLFSEGAKNPASRKLVFEFLPGKGIVRREFGDASVREPAQP